MKKIQVQLHSRVRVNDQSVPIVAYNDGMAVWLDQECTSLLHCGNDGGHFPPKAGKLSQLVGKNLRHMQHRRRVYLQLFIAIL